MHNQPPGRLRGVQSARALARSVVTPYDRLLPLGERPTQFRQGDILQLPDPLSGHSEFLSNFFESFRFAAVQPESLEDNLALAVVQPLPKLPLIIIAEPTPKGPRPNRNLLQLRKPRARDTDLFGQFFIGRFTT